MNATVKMTHNALIQSKNIFGWLCLFCVYIFISTRDKITKVYLFTYLSRVINFWIIYFCSYILNNKMRLMLQLCVTQIQSDERNSNSVEIHAARPITPQPRRAPALPVVLLSSWPPTPRSSTSAWTTTVRPTMLLAPLSEINLSVMFTLATPDASASMFPRSPTWRTAASGAPCSFFVGLKCGPDEVHPFVLSPNSWTWKPCFPGARPVTSPVTATGPSSFWNRNWSVSLITVLNLCRFIQCMCISV